MAFNSIHPRSGASFRGTSIGGDVSRVLEKGCSFKFQHRRAYTTTWITERLPYRLSGLTNRYKAVSDAMKELGYVNIQRRVAGDKRRFWIKASQAEVEEQQAPSEQAPQPESRWNPQQRLVEAAAAQQAPTIRIRAVIAISTDQPRRWSVVGSDDSTDTDLMDLALQGMPNPACLHWLEADVPVPTLLNLAIL